MIKYILLFIFANFVSSLTQVLLKKSANKKYDRLIQEYINCKVIISYVLFFLCTFITIYAYKNMDFSYGPILETSSYLFITILSVCLLEEKLSKRKILGMIIIVSGIFIYII